MILFVYACIEAGGRGLEMEIMGFGVSEKWICFYRILVKTRNIFPVIKTTIPYCMIYGFKLAEPNKEKLKKLIYFK
ncbi:MAG: hypothetical protein DRP16_02195 [Candidatus Aenigmatarchaeota archaeon]|nr:MAG: hypothetical protein DRP16_02195 [Candidatus Aenigmarchaeota archaeon]